MIPSGTKFVGINPNFPTAERKSAQNNAAQEVYTIEEIVEQSGGGLPYKVYTALLTQSGGPSNEGLNSGELTIGVTYTINTYSEGDDFTNVGAPSNTNEVSFVATGTTPNTWNGGTTLVYNTGAPVVTVLENTIGNIWFEYHDEGHFRINSNNLFNGIVPTITNIFGVIESDQSRYLTADKISDGIIRLTSRPEVSIYGNDLLNDTPIEIRVYN